MKAIYIKQMNDEESAIKEGHNLRILFELCQNNIPPFLPRFKFNGNCEIFHFKGSYEELMNLHGKKDLTSYEKEKYFHFLQHHEFYLISENLNNLKYFSCKWKASKKNPFWNRRPKRISSKKLNDFWVEFVKQVRAYLGFGGEEDIDKIKLCLDGFMCLDDALPPESRKYLSQIFK